MMRLLTGLVAAVLLAACLLYSAGAQQQGAQKPAARPAPPGVQAAKEAKSRPPGPADPYRAAAEQAAKSGNLIERRRNLEKVLELDTGDSKSMLAYALTFRVSEPKRFGELARQMAKRFPNDPSTVQAMTLLAEDASYEESLPILEELKRQYAAEPKIDININKPLRSLFLAHLEHDTTKALEATAEARKLLPTLKIWEIYNTAVSEVVQAKTLIAEGKHQQAMALIEKPFNVRLRFPERDLVWARAAAGAGDFKRAYARLLGVLSRDSGERLEHAATEYGAKLGKAAPLVDEEIWQARIAASVPYTEFELTSYATSKYPAAKNVRLSGLRGNVVLVNFWYPG